MEKGKITIGVCDSRGLDREKTVSFCHKYLKRRKEKYRLFEYESGAEFLKHDLTDILLLEVEVKHIDGILLKEVLQIMGAGTRIIFISGEYKRMPEAFGKNVFGFLEKPLEYSSFCERMNQVMEDIMESKSYIYCREIVDYEKVYQKIFFKEIIYVEAQGHKTLIYTELGRKCVVSDKRISEWKGEYLREGFVCCHRSYVVNLQYVLRVEQEVELMNGIRIPVSEKRRAELCEALKIYKKEYREQEYTRRKDFGC